MNELNSFEKLRSNTKCGICGKHCDPADVCLSDHQEDLWLFSAYCPSCNSISLVVVKVEASQEPEVFNELTEAEKSNFYTPIGSSDMLDMHIFLKDFSGDFASLFAENNVLPKSSFHHQSLKFTMLSYYFL